MMKKTICSLSLILLVAWTAGCKRGEKVSSPPPEPPTLSSAAATNTTQIAPNVSPALQTSPDKAPPVPAVPPQTDEVAVMKTTEGEMVLEFWPEVAPATVENFKKLAREGFYDGTAFHRIMKGFMIQGGDPLTKDSTASDRYGTGGPGYFIKAEFNPRKHERGVLSMARSASPDSAGSQFFICLAPQPGLDNSYTTFGKVFKGDDVLDRIGDIPVKARPGSPEVSVPEKRVDIQSLKIVPRDQVK